MKHYIVYNKSDDYGNCKMEIVQTTQKNAKQYYHHKEIDDSDVVVFTKYFGVVETEEEKERSSDYRFYGQD